MITTAALTGLALALALAFTGPSTSTYRRIVGRRLGAAKKTAEPSKDTAGLLLLVRRSI